MHIYVRVTIFLEKFSSRKTWLKITEEHTNEEN